MTHGSLFSGALGFDLASEWMGWNNVFQCDINIKSQELSKKYWPNVKRHEDIKTTDFSIYKGLIDIVTGGDPCQPHSYAGKQKGCNDERFLWPEMLRAIKEINSGWVVNENVEGSVTNGTLDRKISNLENEGYTCWPPLIMPANAFGAIHRRNRVWLVAHSERNKQSREESRYREVRRMGWKFKSMAWHRNWEAAVNFFRGMDDGLPNIVDRTDLMRNAIVPQVAFQIFKAIQQYENITP